MGSDSSLGMGIISCLMSAVPLGWWDLAADQHELLDLKEDRKHASPSSLIKLCIYLCCRDGGELPQPRLELSVLVALCGTLSPLERGSGDGRSHLLCPFLGEKRGGSMVTEWGN